MKVHDATYLFYLNRMVKVNGRSTIFFFGNFAKALSQKKTSIVSNIVMIQIQISNLIYFFQQSCTLQCCGCFGPVGGRSNYCTGKCKAINGGTVVKRVYTWFWVRSSLPKRVWRRCMEYKTYKNGRLQWFKLNGADTNPALVSQLISFLFSLFNVSIKTCIVEDFGF